MKRLLIIMLVLCFIFPSMCLLLIKSAREFIPLIWSFMPCVVSIIGIYLIIKSVSKEVSR